VAPNPTMRLMAGSARTWLTQAGDESRDYTERRALDVAGRLLELCVERKTKPSLCDGQLVVPPRPYPRDTEFAKERIVLAHGPIAVECEPGCETFERGVELVKRAQKASVTAPGWADQLLELLRPHCGVMP
jgi:hypothetical protein